VNKAKEEAAAGPTEEGSQPTPPVLAPTLELPRNLVVRGLDDVEDGDLPAMSGGFSGRPRDGILEADALRSCAPYIHRHRGSSMLVHLPGHVIDDTEAFSSVMDDLALVRLLGVRLVIVLGCRKLIDDGVRARGHEPVFANGIRITDEETMRVVKQAAGAARFEVESMLSKGFQAIPGGSGCNVVGGSGFFTAQPVGVRDGVDYGFTGEVRRVEAARIHERLDAGDLVVLTGVGHSASGTTFNVRSTDLAASVAIAMQATKLVFIMGAGDVLVDADTNKQVQNLRLKDAKMLFGSEDCRDACSAEDEPATARQKRWQWVGCSSVEAVERGVRRAHLVSPNRGALIAELYTRDGYGTMISGDVYDGLRHARPQDVESILRIVKPLSKSGVLKVRNRELVEETIDQYHVCTRDEAVVACGQLTQYGAYAEIGAMAVVPEYRGHGRGEAVLNYLERTACSWGTKYIFVLSTVTMEWFIERGFVEVPVSKLPEERQAIYDNERKSKVYMKKLLDERQVDADELFWDIGTF